MSSFLNRLGLYTKKQYNEVENKQLKVIDKLTENITNQRWLISELEGKLNNLPYDFDFLIGKYSEKEINAFYYHLINNVRNDKTKSHLLERWITRLNNAKETMQPNNL